MYRHLLAFALALTLSAAALAHSVDQPATSADEVTPALIGSKLPELVLKSSDGSAFDLLAAVEKKPTILILYRGGW